jgi:hypothetical protein
MKALIGVSLDQGWKEFEELAEDFGFDESDENFTSFLLQIDADFPSKLDEFKSAIEDNDSISVEVLRSEIA